MQVKSTYFENCQKLYFSSFYLNNEKWTKIPCCFDPFNYNGSLLWSRDKGPNQIYLRICFTAPKQAHLVFFYRGASFLYCTLIASMTFESKVKVGFNCQHFLLFWCKIYTYILCRVYLSKNVLLVWQWFFLFDSLCPINNLSVKQERVFLGWTST